MVKESKAENKAQNQAERRALLINSSEYARNVLKRLKWNKSAHVTKPSHNVIRKVDEHYSNPDVPISAIGPFMNIMANGHWQNVAISSCLCHLFYLRIWRYVFRIIKRPNKHDLFMLMACSSSHLGNQFKRSKLAEWRTHDGFMDWVFADIKATATMEEMFDLSQIDRYWSHHRARVNPHRIYRLWC